MARKPFLPDQLTYRPFSLDDARRAGLNRRSLEGASWRRIAPSIYVWSGLAEDPIHHIEAARHRLPAGAAFSGRTAAWLHGLDVTPCDPIEVTPFRKTPECLVEPASHCADLLSRRMRSLWFEACRRHQ